MKINICKVLSSAAFVVGIVFLSGCSASFNSIPYRGGGIIQNGVSYRLPRTVVAYEVMYTVFKVSTTTKGKTVVRHIAWVDSGDAEKVAAVTLTPSVVGDESAAFVIDTADLAAFSVATAESKFTLSEDGILTAANATFNDKSATILENTISAGLKLGTMATNPALAAMVKGRTNGVVEEVEPDGIKIEKVTTIAHKGSFSYSSLVHRRSDSRSCYVVPTSLVAQKVKQIVPSERISIPTVSFAFSPENYYERVTAESADRMLREKRGVLRKDRLKGVLVRQPVSVPVRIESDGSLLGTTQLLVADAGPTSLVAIKSKPFTERTTELVMHGSGGVSSYSFTGTSQGETASGSVDKVLGKLETELPKIAENMKQSAEAQAAASKAVTPAAADSTGRSDNRVAMQTRESVEQELKDLAERDSEIARLEPAFTKDVEIKEDELALLQAKVAPDDREKEKMDGLRREIVKLNTKMEDLEHEKIKNQGVRERLEKGLK